MKEKKKSLLVLPGSFKNSTDFSGSIYAGLKPDFIAVKLATNHNMRIGRCGFNITGATPSLTYGAPCVYTNK